jgi:hypothetical protein
MCFEKAKIISFLKVMKRSVTIAFTDLFPLGKLFKLKELRKKE